MPLTIVPPLSGLDLGFAAASNTRVKLMVGTGDPNASATDNVNGDLASCAVGSLFLRNDGPDATHCLYVKTAVIVDSTGTWTAK
jgi:hypothetical protein